MILDIFHNRVCIRNLRILQQLRTLEHRHAGTPADSVDSKESVPESGTETDTESEGNEVTALSLMQQVNTAEENVIDDNYRTYYEVFVYSFYDSDGDGIGDLKGLTENLDYINDGDPETDTDLGCNGIWLMPIMPYASSSTSSSPSYSSLSYSSSSEPSSLPSSGPS